MHYIMTFLKNLVHKEANARKLCLSICWGNFIAFSPFLGLHTILIILITPLLGLNMPVAMSASYAINNPWTMLPIYGAGYGVGHFLLYNILHLGPYISNPAWMSFIEQYTLRYLKMPHICLWSFLVGGNVLGIITSLIFYPCILPFFKKLLTEK